jgi:hypothetical protein
MVCACPGSIYGLPVVGDFHGGGAMRKASSPRRACESLTFYQPHARSITKGANNVAFLALGCGAEATIREAAVRWPPLPGDVPRSKFS